ncbi:MAG: DNA polymerase Y family protein [Terracidiphilus sp.]
MTQAAELYACLYAREFPVQALLRLRPELREQPCVVMEGDAPLEQVCSLNTKARLLGMVRGMTRVEVDTFPASAVLTRSLKEEAATRAILLECAGAFSPRLEERSADTAFVCGIDIAGTRSLFGPPEVLARRLVERVRAVGMRACVTVSGNLHAALCMARGLPPSATVKIIPQGEEAAALAELPCAVLDPSLEQAGTFAAWGVHTLGMLAELPEKDLVARMGQEGRRLWQLARGERTHLFQPVAPPLVLAEQMELDSPVELLDSLLFVAGAMLDQLIVRANARLFALAAVTITLTLDRVGTHARTVRPALPTNDKRLWIKLLHLDLEAHPPPSAVLGVALDAEPGATSKVQLGLFSPQLPEASRLDVTLARVRAVVGEENVGRAALVDTHAPDAFRLEAFRLESFRIEAFRVTESAAGTTASTALRAAARQLRPAESVTVTLEAQRPVQFTFRGQKFNVDRAYGPWLACGDWWQPTLWGHEQWDIVARAGDNSLLCCCLVRDWMQGGWQMAALYD